MKKRKRNIIGLDFIGVGAQKAGTSWVHACLYEHPETFLPAGKEIHFFSNHYDKGFDWYANHFKSCGAAHAVGEFSPTYLYHRGAAKRIYDVCPDVRILVCLRDPLERTLSAYRYAIQTGKIVPTMTLNDVVSKKPAYVEHSLYHVQIERYLKYFSQDQLHIMLYEDMTSDPMGSIQTIYAFLGIEPHFRPSMVHRKVNESLGVPRVGFLDRLMKQCAVSLRNSGHADLAWRIGQSRLVEGMRRLNTGSPAQPQLPPRVEADLRRLFAEDIYNLSELLQRDFHETWRGYESNVPAN